MKDIIRPVVVAFAAISIAATYGNVPRTQGCCGKPASAQQHDEHHKSAPAQKPTQKWTITIADGKYTPTVVTVPRNKPSELTFKLGDNPGCGNVLVIEALKVKREIPAEKPYMVRFTPKKAGTIPFTCGMGMLRGKIVVK
jgi:plastocyanin domain-containing protein